MFNSFEVIVELGRVGFKPHFQVRFASLFDLDWVTICRLWSALGHFSGSPNPESMREFLYAVSFFNEGIKAPEEVQSIWRSQLFEGDGAGTIGDAIGGILASHFREKIGIAYLLYEAVLYRCPATTIADLPQRALTGPFMMQYPDGVTLFAEPASSFIEHNAYGLWKVALGGTLNLTQIVSRKALRWEAQGLSTFELGETLPFRNFPKDSIQELATLINLEVDAFGLSALILFGATGVGKTSLGLKLGEFYAAEGYLVVTCGAAELAGLTQQMFIPAGSCKGLYLQIDEIDKADPAILSLLLRQIDRAMHRFFQPKGKQIPLIAIGTANTAVLPPALRRQGRFGHAFQVQGENGIVTSIVEVNDGSPPTHKEEPGRRSWMQRLLH